MRKSIIYCLALSAVLSVSCSKSDEDPSVEAIFDAQVTGEAPTATVTITNTSKVADSYRWTFGEGANVISSTDKNPSVTVDKTGDFTIKLVAKKGNDSTTLSKTVSITGKNGIKTLTDVAFALGTSTTNGIFFSSADAKVYKKSELNATIGPRIDFALVTFAGSSLAYFETPDKTSENFGVIGAKNTKITNYQSTFTIANFSAAANAESFQNLTITHTEDAFSLNSLPRIILFQLNDGKKGAIMVKSYNSTSVIADIKVMKY